MNGKFDKYWSGLLQLDLAFICAMLLVSVCAPCNTGMICRRTTSIAFFLFVGMGVVGFINIMVIKFKPKLMLIPTIMQTVLFFIQFANLTQNGGCKIIGMKCLTTTFPCIRIFNVLIMLVLVIDILRTYIFTKKEETDDEDTDQEEPDTP